MHKRVLLIYLLLLIFINNATSVKAQQAAGPIYIVKAGDTLYSIAARFNVKVDALMSANNITDANQIAVDQQLVIPGLEGVSGRLDTKVINFGDSYRSIIRRSQLPDALLRKLNRLVSPTEFYLGANMIVPVDDSQQGLNLPLNVSSGETMLELAAKGNANPWTLETLNHINGTWDTLPSDTLYGRGQAPQQLTSGLPSSLISAEIRDLPIKQGGTGVIKVKTQPGVSLSGTLIDRPLHFFPTDDGTQVAIQGVYALFEPGIYPLHLDATLPDGTKQSYEQNILIAVSDYGKQDLTVDPSFLDPAVTDPEMQHLVELTTPATPQKLWQSIFQLPVALPYCYKDWFGTRRSYNGSDYTYFHSGLDFGICSDTKPFDIYAPAPGLVVFAGPLIVRGNATIIDHGWGIYSLYAHQQEIYVSAGQQVTPGQLIGKIGGTGRVTGPHLHWEIWAGGIQVNPQDWLDKAYP